MHPAGHLVRRKSHNGGLYRVSRTQTFIVILHRNLAFFQTLCEAVPEYIGRRIEAVVTRLTRNQFGSNATWVRIPPSAPKAAPCGALLFIFAANYARAARWDSNSPCPALCVPPGCNSPADCCKGAGKSHRLRQVSLLNFTLGSDFLLPLCKIPVLFL